MLSLPSALGRAAGQLTDPAVLRVLAKSIAVTLAIFLALGIGAAAGIEALLARWEIASSDEIGALVGLVLMLVGGWLLFRIVALAVLQFFADDVVRAVELKHYPQARASARDPGWREELGMSARATLRAVLANLAALVLAIPLLFTAIGPAVLFWTVNAWLLGRELQDLAWARHRHTRGAEAPIRAPERFLLGGVVAGLLAVPFVNLLAPVIGAAAAVHLVHRSKEGSVAA
ncbi:EI24 domain-containing protein [Altererythrobacter sp. C41]|uniref:EI24 domain-containing protein n=1 Tax=Altererythrobacter sp. C41 TaxID=2806021 RepID=UPI001933A404|nr:EI24 domain-containing protein [Altererythrobacter sp. C41]MBM0169343.1 EI24 domain-containing protein [Altererythrobacter sp. C41]